MTLNEANETVFSGKAVRSARFTITGMSCAGCAAQVEKAVHSVAGVIRGDVNLALAVASLDYYAAPGVVDAVRHAVEKAGYGARLVHAVPPDRPIGRAEWIELAFAMMFCLPFIVQMVVMQLQPGQHFLPGWLELVLASPIQFWFGRRFYLGAWRAIRARSGNMDVLVALGSSAAYAYSLVLLSLPEHGGLYFEASSVIVTLVLLGKFLEGRATHSASAALRKLLALRPEQALVLRDGRELMVAPDQIAIGEIVLIRAGERVAVDGEIVFGESEFDESLITGESMPVPARVGDHVTAGSLNGPGLVRVRTERTGDDTTLAHIARLVEQAQIGKAPVQRLVDRISAVFVPCILVLAVASATVWWVIDADFGQGLKAMISVLVIACPCALGLATPTALVAGTGAAARAGILIRNIDALERACHIDMVVFDKTGTLSRGELDISSILTRPGESEDGVLALAASAQRGSQHPIARAIIASAGARQLALEEPDSFSATVGEGISAEISGHSVRIGRAEFVSPDHMDADWQQAGRGMGEAGNVMAWIARDGVVIGVIALHDALFEDAPEALRALARLGVTARMVSGDNQAVVDRVSQGLLLDRADGGIRPEQKAQLVSAWMAEGHRVAMVGDGVNDAPALATANIGIAMGSGADVARSAAGIVLMRSAPSLVGETIRVARATRAKIRQNLFWAFLYNLLGLPIAALGLLQPGIAGAAMAASSVCVVVNSLLLTRWRPRRDTTQPG